MQYASSESMADKQNVFADGPAVELVGIDVSWLPIRNRNCGVNPGPVSLSFPVLVGVSYVPTHDATAPPNDKAR